MDVNKKTSAIAQQKKADSYENTILSVEKVKPEEKDVREESYYDQLRFDDKSDESKCGQSDKSLYMLKCMIYVQFAMLGVLYIAGIVAIIITTTLSKDQDNNIKWTQWSPWSACNITCGSGLQTRFRTCAGSTSATRDDQCSGNAKDISFCHLPPCSENYASFATRMDGTGSIVKSNKRVVFNKILNNNMKGYNNNSGVFTAPFSGVYFFAFFIEIDGAYGKVELRVNNEPTSFVVAYGMFLDFGVSGFNHNFTFGSSSTKNDDLENDIYESIRCVGGKFSISGFDHIVKIQPNYDDCPYKDGVVATGGNSVVTHVNAGDQVWIQTPVNVTLSIRPEGTSFTGILLSRDD